MTPVRPGSPISASPAQTPVISPARAELMRLMGLTAPAQAASAQTSAPVATQVRIEPTSMSDPHAPLRPGSLLDIRV